MEDGKPDGEQEAPFVDQAEGERIFLREDSCVEILEKILLDCLTTPTLTPLFKQPRRRARVL
jgi:hypothetical protein